MKKVLSFILSAALIFSVIYVPAFAAETATVYFDYDFEDYKGGGAYDYGFASAAQNGADLINEGADMSILKAVNYSGNKGMQVAASQTAPQWMTIKPQASAITNGKLYLGFDMALDSEWSGRDGFINLNGNGKTVAYINKNGFFANGTTHYFTAGKANQVEIVFTVTTPEGGASVTVADVYVNGSFKTGITYDGVKLENINFGVNGVITYFDNLRLSTMTDTSFEAKNSTATGADTYFDVSFTEGIGDTAVDATSVVLKNADSEAVNVTKVEKISGRTLRVYPEGTLAAGSYSVDVSTIVSSTGKTDVTPAALTVTAADTAAPVVYVDYDFEDYAGGAANKFGYESAMKNGASLVHQGSSGMEVFEATTLEGDKGMKFTGTAQTYMTIQPPAITDGKLYLSFDLKKDSSVDAETVIALNANNSYRFAYINKSGFYGATNYGAAQDKIYHIDYVFTVSTVDGAATTTIDAYIDGVSRGSKSFSTSLSNINFRMNNNITYFDNLRVATTSDVSYNAKVKGVVLEDANYVDVAFTEAMGTASIGDISVTDENDRAVSVDRVEKYRERTLRIYFAEPLAAGAYKINIAPIKSFTGKKLTNGEIALAVQGAPLLMVDMESTYEDGKITNALAGSGITIGNQGADGYVGALITEANGNHYIKPKNNGENRLVLKLNNPATTGKLYIRFDVNASDIDAADNKQASYLMMHTGSMYCNLLRIDAGKINASKAQICNVWNDSDFTEIQACASDSKYTVEVVYDLDTTVAQYYVDGVLKHTKQGNNTYDLTNAAKGMQNIYFQLNETVNYLDNISVSYLTPNSYRAVAEPIVDGSKSIVLHMTERGTVTADDITVMNGEASIAVSNVAVSGTKVAITTAEALSKENSYTVSFGDAVGMIGNAAQCVTVTPVDEFILNSYSLTDVDGNVIDDLTKVAEGTTVKVNVTVTNNSSKKEAILLAGSYVNDGLQLENAGSHKDVVLPGKGVTTTVSAEVKVDTPAAAEIYGYLWDSLEGLNPYTDKLKF